MGDTALETLYLAVASVTFSRKKLVHLNACAVTVEVISLPASVDASGFL